MSLNKINTTRKISESEKEYYRNAASKHATNCDYVLARECAKKVQDHHLDSFINRLELMRNAKA